MKCPKCFYDNPSDTKFCGNCAYALHPSEEIADSETETLDTPIQELTTGSTFVGRYQIIEELGKGGMGNVYKVLDTKIKEKIALKLIKPEIASDKGTIERFANELRLSRKIGHRNVCKMFDIGESGGTHFITMEYVGGEDLKSMSRMAAGLSVGAVLSIGKQVCDGLAEAHSLGVVHRDLKPQNIMIDKGGNAKIMDFGIARSLKEKGITGSSVLVGTPEYMSPEQAEAKEIDHRSDIYSLGVILYEMATGRVPFEGDTALSIAMKHKGEIPKDPKQFNPNIPDDLSAVILKCLEKDKAQRYQTAGEVRSALEKIEKGIPSTEVVIPKPKPGTSKEITVTFGPKKLFLPILGLAFLALLGLVIGEILPKKQEVPAKAVSLSLAVLPFVDDSPEKGHEYLSEGIPSTLINALNTIPNLRVPARTSAFSFVGKSLDIQEIGQKLNVEHVLEGSIQVVGNNLRVTASLIKVKDGYQLWNETYNRRLEGVFAIQDDIAQAIVTALKIRLLGEKGTPLIKNYTENFEAYRLYLQGLNLWNKRGETDLVKSIEYFEKAIGIDPNYALAYAGLGDAYGILGNNGYWPAEKAYPKAKAAALKALAIDNRLAEAHASLAGIMMDHDWDFVGAKKEFELAIGLSPGYATAHHWYAFLLSNFGRHEEAIREIKIARSLDPLSPRISANVGFLLYSARRYGQAIEELRKALQVAPNHWITHKYLGWAYEAMGKYKEAIQFYRRNSGLRGESQDGQANIAGCYALMGKHEEARKILNDIIEYSKGDYYSSVSIAEVFAALGDKDQTFAWLEKAFQERDPVLIDDLKNHHRFERVRSDPRFTDLLRRTGLEK
jgi:eukaryotic-like serine/threonine-protein kinase